MMTDTPAFDSISKQDDRTYTFTLSPIHVTYANTLRRLILTYVETVGFRSDMTSTGTTTDVVIKQNDTPMTNEMLADRVGLIPLHVTEPLKWKEDDFQFRLSVKGNKDHMTYVKAADFTVHRKGGSEEEEEKEESAAAFFKPNPITGDTCLLAVLTPDMGSTQQSIEIIAKASKGTGREHARFCPVSQCSYEYSRDDNPARVEEMFQQWLNVAKKAGGVDKASERYEELRREFNTMQIKRCFKINEKNEPYSFDFTVESVGVLSVPYIVERACEIGAQMCSKYTNMTMDTIPSEITISPAESRVVGFDFLVRGHDHTLGNLLQTWIVENLIDGPPSHRLHDVVTYAGYAVPHPLRDEMVLRIGVADGEEQTAKEVFAAAAKGCVEIFQALRSAWISAMGGKTAAIPSRAASRTVRRSATAASSASSAAATAAAAPAAPSTIKRASMAASK